MQAKMWIVLIVVCLTLAGCGEDIVGPYPADPAICECPELHEYIAGLPMIGELFSDHEIWLADGVVLIYGGPIDPEGTLAEILPRVAAEIPDSSVFNGVVLDTPLWKVTLLPGPRTDASSIQVKGIDGVLRFGGVDDPDTHDPEGVAAIQAEAIERLADLEAALISIEENSVP